MDQYRPGVYADQELAVSLILHKVRELMDIAGQTSDPNSDLLTRAVKNISIMTAQTDVFGPAKRFIPHYIAKHLSEQNEHVLVVDPCPDALMLQLTCGLNQSLLCGTKFIKMDELRDLLLQLFRVPKEQCRALGWLYAATRLESMPSVSTISLSGSHEAVHCYVYGKYMTKLWTRSFSPERMD